jgi:hypothetical protein
MGSLAGEVTSHRRLERPRTGHQGVGSRRAGREAQRRLGIHAGQPPGSQAGQECVAAPDGVAAGLRWGTDPPPGAIEAPCCTGRSEGHDRVRRAHAHKLVGRLERVVGRDPPTDDARGLGRVHLDEPRPSRDRGLEGRVAGIDDGLDPPGRRRPHQARIAVRRRARGECPGHRQDRHVLGDGRRHERLELAPRGRVDLWSTLVELGHRPVGAVRDRCGRSGLARGPGEPAVHSQRAEAGGHPAARVAGEDPHRDDVHAEQGRGARDVQPLPAGDGPDPVGPMDRARDEPIHLDQPVDGRVRRDGDEVGHRGTSGRGEGVPDDSVRDGTPTGRAGIAAARSAGIGRPAPASASRASARVG